MNLLLLTPLLLANLQRPEGVRISYETRGESDTALVFVPGWASERGAWREQAAYFAGTYQVVTFDLAGHGQSTPGRRKVWTLAKLAADVGAVVERLKAPKVILIGHSMGGLISLLAAAHLPKVRAVIVVESVHNADANLTREQAEQFAGMFTKDFRGTMTKVIGDMFPAGSPLAGEVTANALKCDPVMLTALIRDYPQVDFPAMLRAVKVPIRAIDAAPRMPGDPATNLAVNRKYSDFDATVLNGVGHFLMLEKPGEFNALLREWLAALR